ncbi:glycosyltransferase [Bacillus massiliigorillae]|uniref:glycosyltransferase n=1 Tax=Bacillus massiliigorillae TaxID=1243664 RepID=UPI00039C258D|nr:glycosyltransferase [Bacillus massiliigorillae]
MINILFLITGLNVGGAEMQVYHMIKRLKKIEACHPIVVSLLEPGPVGQKLKDEKVKVYSLQMERGKMELKAITKLNKIVKQEEIHLVHSHLFHANVLARVIKIFNPRIKIVTTIHNLNIGGRNREKILQYTNFLSQSNTIISETARQYFIKKGAFANNQLKLIPNGVDMEEFQSNEQLRIKTREQLQIGDAFVWLAVGRFEVQKNYYNMLRAFSILVESQRNIQLLLAGTGPLLEEMKELAAKLNITEYIHFLGYQSNISALMNVADGYVMSSSWEGMPLVLLEASAVGIPIVCTDVGGNKEVVLDTETGYIVKPDCHTSLAGGMNRLMSLTTHERLNMGENAKAYMRERYEMNQIMEHWKAIYKEALS